MSSNEGQEGDDSGSDQSGEDEIVTLIGEDGTEVDHVWLGLVELDNEQFALLCPVDEFDVNAESTNVYAYYYTMNEDETDTFEPVEDHALLARIQVAAEEMFAAEEDRAAEGENEGG